MKSNTILKNIAVCGLFAVLFVPLFVDNSLFFPFIAGKNFLFRFIVEIVAAIWLVLAIKDKRYRPRYSWIGMAMTVFVIIVAVADAFSPNPYKSFWSNYERMEGWITMIHLLLYFFVAGSLIVTEKIWNRFFNTSLIVSAIVCIYGFLQLEGKIVINQGGVRLDATFGNAAYLAGYILIHIFIALIMAWRHRRNSVALFHYGLLFFCQLIIIYYTATRGAILGLIGGLGVALLLFVILGFTRYKNESVILRNGAAGVLAAVVLLVGGVWLAKDSSFVKSSPVLVRLTSISTNDALPRLRIWQMAWQGFKERPILGWGQESFNFVFNKYYDPKMWSQEQWFDRAHDVFFDWLIAAGILGLCGYLALFFFAFRYLWKSSALSLVEKCLFSGLLVGYFFHNIFVFDNLTSYIMFATLLAYFHSMSNPPAIAAFERLPEVGNENGNRLVLPIVAVAVLIIMYGIELRPYYANRDLLDALQEVQLSKFDTALADFQKVFASHTFATAEALEQLSTWTINIAGVSTIPEATKKSYFDLTQREFAPFAKAHDNDARYQYFYGMFLDRFGLYADATPYLEKAHELSPNKQTIIFELAPNYYSRGQLDKSFNAFKQAYELDPTFSTARERYVLAAGIILADVVKKEPNNVLARASLLNVYIEIGDKTRALEQLNALIKLDPTFKAKNPQVIQKINAMASNS